MSFQPQFYEELPGSRWSSGLPLVMFLKGGHGDSPRARAWIAPFLAPPSGAHFRHLASSWRSWALSWLILALWGTILSPSCSKMAPRWPNIGQHSAKMSQHSLQEPSQDPPKPSKSDELSSFFWFSLVLARSPPRSKKGRQDATKSAPSWPSWPPSWPS